MLRNGALLLSIILAHVPLAISQTCIWTDGSIATGYVPCKTGGTSGTCCHTAEACLESGLCYGANGLVSRGACVDSWDTPDCVKICTEFKDVRYHANIYPCNAGTGADNPENWWCGSTTLKTCSPDEGNLFKFSPGLPVKIIPYLPSSTAVESSAKTTSPTSTSPFSTPSSADPGISNPTSVTAEESECPVAAERAKVHLANMMAAVGTGVGAPLGVLALAFIVLFMKERRLRKKLTAAKDVDSAGAEYGSDKDTYLGQDYVQRRDQGQVQYMYKAENEMSADRDCVELGGHQRPVRDPVHELGSNYRY